jgi:hypothetical protein
MRLALFPAFAVVCFAVACGKSSPSPTDPSPSPAREIPASYVGSVALPGRTGVLVTNTARSVAWLRPDAFAALFDLIESRVHAQGSTAVGTLALDDGTTIWLTGSGGGSSVQLSGPGGYSVTASVSGGTLSGTVTAPAGSGSVSPLVRITPLVPEPGDPNGTFEATYARTTSGYFRNVNASNQTIQRDCGYTVELTGTIRLDVRGNVPNSGGFRYMDFRDNWRETRTILPPCQGATNFSPTISEGESGVLTLFQKATDVLQFGIENKFTDPNGSTVTRAFAFIGGYTGATTLQGTVVRLANNVVPTNTGQHFQGFSPVQIEVTLSKVADWKPNRRPTAAAPN